VCCCQLKLRDVLGRRPFGAFSNLEAHPVTFSEILESFHVDVGVVNEYVRAIFLLDEAVAFLFTKELYSSSATVLTSFKKFLLWSQISGHRFGKGNDPSERNRPFNMTGPLVRAH